MGCAASRLQDSPPVVLCRHRCDFLDEAIHHRFAFAHAHAAYLNSLTVVGDSLQSFFQGDLVSSSPVLQLPKRTKGESDSPEKFQDRHSRSHSGSHLHFRSGSDSDSDESDSESLHHIDEEPPPPYENGYFDGRFMKINYMRNQTSSSSVVHFQKPIGEEESSSSYFSHDNSHQNLNGYSNYRAFEEPKLPPSPPRATAWDFLNPFETFDRYYYPVYISSHAEWKNVREEEGIPDLEYEDNEVVKEVHVDRKPAVSPEESGPSSVVINNAADDEPGPSIVSEVEYSLQKNVADEDERPTRKVKENQNHLSGFKSRGGINNPNPVKEIQIQFHQASESGHEIAEFLEAGKPLYKPKNKVQTRILNLPSALPLRRCTAKSNNNSELSPELKQQGPRNLSSILHEIYLWEKKLYEEVKGEEKMRVLHQRKSMKLLNLDRSGAEAPKIDATRTLLRSLSTKIKIAIQVVDKISMKINELRDDDLCPQLFEFIHGLRRMWKSMLDSHRAQREAVEKVSKLDGASREFEAISHLENDLIHWAMSFTQWYKAQQGYVRSLNSWLLKCLLYIPEETPDGPVPFSPGRIGAPPIFVVCNQWSQSLDRVSDHQVVDSMQELTARVLHLWQHKEKDDAKIVREIESFEKRILQISSRGDRRAAAAVYQHDASSRSGNLQGSLHRVLEAMEKFAADSLKVYEELQQCIVDIHGGQNSMTQ